MPLIPSEIVKDAATGTQAEVVEDYGQELSIEGKLCDVALVKVFLACAHHKAGDFVIWFIPVEEI